MAVIDSPASMGAEAHMTLHPQLLACGFALPACEKHFHDHDETWLILSGRGTGYWIDHAGERREFTLAAGDVWMVPAGFEHGSDGPNSGDFRISVLNGSLAPGAQAPGHYHVEQEGYLPQLELRRRPTRRYAATLVPDTMTGVMFTAKGRAELRQEPSPSSGPGTVLCRTLHTGLTNGTERNVLTGGNYGGSFPRRCGYQNVGRVLEIGEGVSGIKVGDVVFSGDFCQHTAYFAAPAGPQALLARLPDGIDPRQAALLGVASVALHDVRRAGICLGERVLVVGAGLIGQCTAQAARLAGAEVTVVDPDQGRLELAARLGARRTMRPDRDWRNLAACGPFDAVFEDSGAPILDQLIGPSQLLRQRARLVLIAGRERVDYRFNHAQGWELTVLHAGHFVIDDLNETLRLLLAGSLQIGPLLREVVAIADAPALYQRLLEQPGTLLGTVFDW